MEVTTAPNAARGQATLLIAGTPRLLKFGMNVMRDLTKLTGQGPAEFATSLGTNFDEAATAIVSCAVKRAVPASELPNGFSQDDAGDLLDGLTQAENEALAEAITEAVSVGPLMGALLANLATRSQQGAATEAPATNGNSTSTSLSVS